MGRLTKQRSRKAGLPPGTLIHMGEKRAEKVRIRVVEYDETHCQELETKVVEECFSFKGKPTVTWINVDGIHEIDVLEKLGECYGIHSLVLEDVLNTDHRAKVEDYGDYIYTVLKMISFDDETQGIAVEQISLILGSNFLISFQERQGKVFDQLRERIRKGNGRIRKMGADYLAYSLLDLIVDHYFIALERLGEKIEVLEEQIVDRPSPETLQILHHLKGEMLSFRKFVWPLREAIVRLERGGYSLIQESTQIYLRDVYDHTIQVIDTIETFREMLSGMLDIYLSSLSNKTNEVMKILTIIATIFMPLTFLAGVYGMNFRYMPELEKQWGYPAILLIMFAVCIFMFAYFKRKKWL
jgi:magnesium transporter